MPYETGSDKLPEHVKKLDKDKQEAWVKAFNGAYETYSKQDLKPDEIEAKAFAAANSTLGKKEQGEKYMDYVSSPFDNATSFEDLDAIDKAQDQAEKMYRVSDQTVMLVSNVMRNPEIEDKPSALSKIVEGLKNRLSGVMGRKEKLTADDRTIFHVTKDKAGNYRWFTLVSNIFRDEDYPPEIFETKAHREYVHYVDETGNYPELWFWHTPGTKSGKADWVDFDDGFLMASGTFDKDKQDVAERLSKIKNLGVSHGFNYRYSNKQKGIIGWYRTYEISPLPRDKAANPWAGIEILKSEATMDTKKRKFLVDALGEDRVKELEARPAELSSALKAAGIEYKEVTEPETEKVDNPVDTKEVTEAAVKAITDSETFKSLLSSLEELKSQKEKDNKTITDLQATVTAMGEAIKELKKTDDEKIAAALTPRSKAAEGLQRASESTDNLVDPDKDKELGQKAAPSWLGAALSPLSQK